MYLYLIEMSYCWPKQWFICFLSVTFSVVLAERSLIVAFLHFV